MQMINLTQWLQEIVNCSGLPKICLKCTRLLMSDVHMSTSVCSCLPSVCVQCPSVLCVPPIFIYHLNLCLLSLHVSPAVWRAIKFWQGLSDPELPVSRSLPTLTASRAFIRARLRQRTNKISIHTTADRLRAKIISRQQKNHYGCIHQKMRIHDRRLTTMWRHTREVDQARPVAGKLWESSCSIHVLAIKALSRVYPSAARYRQNPT